MSVKIRRNEIRKIYGNAWNGISRLAQFTLNQKMAIEDTYYNGPKISGAHTNYCICLKRYIASKNINYLDEAVYEILVNSNPTNHDGLKNRRRAQALMLCDDPAKVLARLNASRSS